MFSNLIHNAEYLIRCAESSKTHITNSSKWRSIYIHLQDAATKEDEEIEENISDFEPCSKHLCLHGNPLQRFCENNDSLNLVIINLLPLDNGYSIMLKSAMKHYIETIQLPYDEYEILQYVDNEQIPPLLIEALDNLNDNFFYSGCIIAEIRDYGIAATQSNFEMRYVLLRPTQQTLLGDVNLMAAETSQTFRWENDEKLALESYLVLATAEPLCLDPSPAVQIMKNLIEDRGTPFKRHSIKRYIRRNGLSAASRRRGYAELPTPQSLKLCDFIHKLRAKKGQTSSANGLRLPKNVVDLWRKTPLDVSSPASGIDITEYVKPLTHKLPNGGSPDLLKIQRVHLKSETRNRDVYSRITIYQRPSDMQYFGKLQSNKYFQQTIDSGPTAPNSCKFPLGTENRANLYILQYQELFAEDGRRPATVTVIRPLRKDVVYQIPLVHQPWQLEQDKALYAVGSINDIPVQHWKDLRVSGQSSKPKATANQPPGGSAVPRAQATTSQTAVANNGAKVNNPITTPTLNTVTLQPESQSAFVFPLPRQVSQQNGASAQSPHQNINPNPLSGTHPLDRRLSADTISLVTGSDGGIYRIQESGPSGRRSRQGSAQEIFNFTTDTGNPLSSVSGTTPLSTPTLGEANNLSNQNVDVVASAINQGSLNVKLPLSNVPTQQLPRGAMSSPVTLQLNKPQVQNQQQQLTVQPQQQATGAVIRMPVSNSGGQQITAAINLLGGSRNASGIQQIQLAPGSRLPGATVSINASQLPASIAMQLAAAANQLNQDKGSSSTAGVQQITIATSVVGCHPSSGAIIVTNNNNSAVGTVQQRQQQHLRAVPSNHFQQAFVQNNETQPQSATLTFNPRTQVLTANMQNNNVPQPVQLVQVGSNSVQQVPIRIPGQQLVLNTVRTSNADHGTNQTQMSLTQHLQQHIVSGSNATNNGPKRNRKRKNTPT